MKPKGSAAALDMRRLIGGKMAPEGRGVRAVSRLTGASSSTVSRWKQDLEGGMRIPPRHASSRASAHARRQAAEGMGTHPAAQRPRGRFSNRICGRWRGSRR